MLPQSKGILHPRSTPPPQQVQQVWCHTAFQSTPELTSAPPPSLSPQELFSGMSQLGAIAALAASLVAAALFSAIHKIEEGHIGVYYRYVRGLGGSAAVCMW